MSELIVPQHVRVAADRRPSVFIRGWSLVRCCWRSVLDGVRAAFADFRIDEDDLSYESGAGWPAPPLLSLPGIGPVGAVQGPARVPDPARYGPARVPGRAPQGETLEMRALSEPPAEPPLVYLPAAPQDVLRNIAHDVLDMLGRDVSNGAVLIRMRIHTAELAKRARSQAHLERRSHSNTAETQMDAALLAAADRRGASDEEMQERSARVLADMLARARRASDPAPTGTLPRIAEDTPDPRSMPTVPPDVAPGDDAEPVSPVHADETLPALPGGLIVRQRVHVIGGKRAQLVGRTGVVAPGRVRIDDPVVYVQLEGDPSSQHTRFRLKDLRLANDDEQATAGQVAPPVPSEPFLADDGDPAEVPSLAAVPAAEVAPDRPWPAGAASVPSLLADRAMGLTAPVAPQRVDPESLVQHARAEDGAPGRVLCGAVDGKTAMFPRFVDCPDCLAAWAGSDAAAPQPDAGVSA